MFFLLQLGGPSWKVGLGRRDSLTANITAANTFIPSPTSNLTALVSSFAVQGLSFKNMVALSGNYLVSSICMYKIEDHVQYLS